MSEPGDAVIFGSAGCAGLAHCAAFSAVAGVAGVAVYGPACSSIATFATGAGGPAATAVAAGPAVADNPAEPPLPSAFPASQRPDTTTPSAALDHGSTGNRHQRLQRTMHSEPCTWAAPCGMERASADRTQ
ncbi:hypothetical protein IU21_00265 [Mycobacterium tuberculosis]|nr:hypothetical protein IU21_00265 [Mycobacterium tuberculosis]